MNRRQLKLARLLLDVLNEKDGVPIGDVMLHAGVNDLAAEYVPLQEINEALELCDRNGWLITTKSKFKGDLRTISDAGRAARQEMR